MLKYIHIDFTINIFELVIHRIVNKSIQTFINNSVNVISNVEQQIIVKEFSTFSV